MLWKGMAIKMYIIAGLGNPGTQYEMTRHNIGFHTIDYIADELNLCYNIAESFVFCHELTSFREMFFKKTYKKHSKMH